MNMKHTCAAEKPSVDLVTGFTLVELLVVISIIGILVAILIPSFVNSRDRARMLQSHANLRQLHSISMQYSNEHGGRLPAASMVGQSSGNFYTVLQNAGYLTLRNFGQSGGDTFLFNPLLVQARKNQIRNSTAASYAINFWATEGAMRDGVLERDSTTGGRVVNVMNPSRMALFMDGVWNGITWPVQIGNWASGQNTPDFSFPSKSVGKNDPDASAQVIFADGHIKSIARKDFVEDLNDTFWRGF
jgi:prepilin-type N-terminal cleavage/methylation domain-containing protein